MVLIKGEVRRWLADDVTADFFDRIKDEIMSMDASVHETLLKGNMDGAAVMNARLQQLKEVTMLTEIMLEEAKGE